MEHEHHHHEVSGKGLWWTILLNMAITLAEGIGGLISGSMALISDATHNFSDVLSLIISYVANRLTLRKATSAQTYGYKRSEILAAFINSTTLIVLAIFIMVEGIQRFFVSETIDAQWVIWLAVASILVNGLSVLIIRNDAKGNMNIRSSLLHLFSDMMTSVAVLLGGLAMKYLQWYWIDALFSILIALYLLYSSWDILKSSLKIMMQFTPDDVNVDDLVANISKISGIKNMHHVHLWQIDEHDMMLEAHVDMEKDFVISEFEKILEKIKQVLDGYNIHHINIQPEFSVSDNKQIIINN